MKTYIHVNQHKIRANKKHGTNEPVITIKEGRKNTYCHSVEILGPSKLFYGGNDKPILPCGARVVIETESDSGKIKLITKASEKIPDGTAFLTFKTKYFHHLRNHFNMLTSKNNSCFKIFTFS